MKVDATLTGDLAEVAGIAREKEEAGFSGLRRSETGHNPFLPLLLAAEHTTRIELCSSIAVAFARSPMTVAAEANDLQQFSRGRFTLGLGSQVRAHIERRFSMQWSHPASRMRDFVLALRAIWASWNSGEELRYEGEFYSHTLQPPLFNPGPNPFGAPRVVVAAVGPNMAKVAGEVGDGVLVHAFTTPRYLREVTLPAVTAGLELSGRRREDFEVFCPAFVVTGSTEAEIAAAARVVRRQLAFYGSTPAYRPVLEVQGQGELATRLHALSREGAWEQMGDLIDDDLLGAFAVVGPPDEVPGLLRERLDGVVDRLSFYAPYEADPGIWIPMLRQMRSG